MDPLPLQITLLVSRILDELEVEYCLVGSLASSAFGVPRSTLDTDLLIDLYPHDVEPLRQRLEGEFYVSEIAMREAVVRRSMFNAIHLSSSFKVDLYVLGLDRFDNEEFRRRRKSRLSPNDDFELSMLTVEDLILSKLRWYRLGNEISERQWLDIVGALKVTATMDESYLLYWANELGLIELLQRAYGDAGKAP